MLKGRELWSPDALHAQWGRDTASTRKQRLAVNHIRDGKNCSVAIRFLKILDEEIKAGSDPIEDH